MNTAFSTISGVAGKLPAKQRDLEEDVMLEVVRTSVFVFMTLTLAAGSYIAVFMA